VLRCERCGISAIDAGVKLTVLVPDRVPLWDRDGDRDTAKANARTFLGPNTAWSLSPGKVVVGMIGGRAESARQWFKPGIPSGVGVISRSGGMASSTGYYLGQSACASHYRHIGAMRSLAFVSGCSADVQAASAYGSIVIFGIGSSQEEDWPPSWIHDRKVTKPVIAYIGGKAAAGGARFSSCRRDH